MSKIVEYLKLVPKGLKNPIRLVSGWITDLQLEYGELPDDQVREIITRRSICHTCPFNSQNAKISNEYKELFGKSYETERDDLHCGICQCPVSKKTASLASNCGMETYNNDNPNNEQPLKWQKYNDDKTVN